MTICGLGAIRPARHEHDQHDPIRHDRQCIKKQHDITDTDRGCYAGKLEKEVAFAFALV